MPQSHGVVWMDSKEAHVFRFGADDVKMERVKAHMPFRKVHHKAGAIGAGHVAADLSYLDHIADALRGVHEWLLTGPAQAKTDFVRHIETHIPQLKAKLVAVEAMDHPTDAELVAHARRYFKLVDKMQPNSPTPPGQSTSA
jgi:stalled ribosome rescue protein Dom34